MVFPNAPRRPLRRRRARESLFRPRRARRGRGRGLPPERPRSVPPPTPKRVGPRQTKKRFTGEDALTPQERKAKDAEGIRLAKALARLGVASRRASEALVFAGRVTGC